MKLHLLAASLLLLLAACGKAEDSSSNSTDGGGGGGSGASASGADSDAKPWDDPAKPYLSDKKMGDFISSLKDSNGPFDTIRKGKVTAFNAEARMDDFEAAAKKHGFQSGEEYFGAWMRINGAMTQVMMDESNQAMIKIQEDSMKAAEEALKKPDLTPEMRQAHEDRIKGAKETIQAYKQPREGGINAQDIETYKKHRAAFDEAMKEWSK